MGSSPGGRSRQVHSVDELALGALGGDGGMFTTGIGALPPDGSPFVSALPPASSPSADIVDVARTAVLENACSGHRRVRVIGDETGGRTSTGFRHPRVVRNHLIVAMDWLASEIGHDYNAPDELLRVMVGLRLGERRRLGGEADAAVEVGLGGEMTSLRGAGGDAGRASCVDHARDVCGVGTASTLGRRRTP